MIPFIKDPVTKERKQIHPEDIHLTAKDFEASKDNISKDEWENLHALKEKRLNGMPKTTPKSDQVIMLQINTFVKCENMAYEVYVMMRQNTQNMNK
ncbi:alpha amylase [Escherichia coli]|uniref:Alpha amylase n=1 Tax=Escherichia coli TaxID=562 RepID=A0A377DPI8_ECOLX|nr:alpha amylase [Escherichia coli]